MSDRPVVYDILGRPIRYVTLRCTRCGCEYEVPDRVRTLSKYCPPCRKEADREAKRRCRPPCMNPRAEIRASERERAERRAAFFSALDRRNAQAQRQTPVAVKEAKGVHVEVRGRCCGTWSGTIDTSNSHSKSYI